MYISHVNGKLNNAVLIQRDTIINANTLMHLGRNNYNEGQRNNIKRLREKQKVKYGF